MSKDYTVVREFIDRFDNVIRPGDYLVYSNAAGRASKVAVGQLLEVRDRGEDWRGQSQYTLMVMSYQESAWALRTDDRAGPKRVAVTVTERVLRYDPTLIPKKVRLLIKDATEALP